MAEDEVVLVGLHHLGLFAVEAVAVKGVRGRVHLRVKVNGRAGEADPDALGKHRAVFESDGLKDFALRGDCGVAIFSGQHSVILEKVM